MRLLISDCTGTRSGIFPPMLLMINKYTATAEVRIVLGTSSTTIARVMPIHISAIVILRTLHECSCFIEFIKQVEEKR